MADETPSVAAEPSLAAIYDQRLHDLLASRFRPEIMRTFELRRYAGELPFHLEPAAWYAGFLSVHEGSAPMDVREGMQTAVPQAQLRDLFRPVFSTQMIAFDFIAIELDPGARRAYVPHSAAQRLAPMPELPRSVELLAEDQARRRAFLREVWQPHLKDEEPRRVLHVPIEPSLSA